MADVKHTPRPWVIIPARPYDGDDPDLEGSFEAFAGIEGGDGNPVCVFGDAAGSATMFENEADYRLIAAAPDLLEALKETKELLRFALLSTTPDLARDAMVFVRKADAAVAKAEAR